MTNLLTLAFLLCAPARADMATLPPFPWMLKMSCQEIRTKMNDIMVVGKDGQVEEDPTLLVYNGALKAKNCDKYVYKPVPPAGRSAECAQLTKDILSLPTTTGTARQRQVRAKLMSEWHANKCPGYPGQAH